MKVDWPLYVFATALLWFSRSWMRRGPRIARWRKRRGANENWLNTPQDGSSLSFRREFRKLRNYLDWLRAAAASVALAGGFGVPAAVMATEIAPRKMQVLALQVGAAAIGLLIQVIRLERRRISLAAPAFYLAGVVTGFCGPWAGICSFAVAWAASPIVPNAQGFLTIQAVAAVAFGYVFHGVDLLLLSGGALCFAPVLLSLLARRPLIVFSRRSSGETRGVGG